ncbi:MarR family transcriptional regulator [Amycolatopsis acidicola]|uniref:MarR family transcriptional regulator n=1 Tax=Amycolatopsis acidicola TaxID=2596893 RepID=A0A5N0UWX8_9PSEU|nr:MarR family transcriptional regulator [Amycolatopsis acidicola]KAA9157781.1 MarR family transcriptional regulator [Amycolatopsis acidicola]
MTEPTICLPASKMEESGDQVDEETMTRLRQAVSRIARQLNNTATDEGLTPSQATILGVIARRGPINLTELAELEGLNPTMLSRMISKLDSEGLISRTRAPEDLRSAAVKVTKRGRTLEAKVRAGRAKVVARALDGLGEKQQQSLTKALPALEELVDQLRETQAGTKR